MIQYHPDDNMLIEFANGSLDWGLSILINVHLEQCSQCRKMVKTQEQIAASLFNTPHSEPLPPEAFDLLMARIASSPRDLPSHAPVKVQSAEVADYPRILTKLLHKSPPLPWRQVFRHLKACRLLTDQQKYEISLHNICSGGYVNEHDHRGIEITLVIKGTFSDGEGIYQPGDFISRLPGQIHSPTAGKSEDCLCLSAVDAPIKLTGFTGMFINPFLTIKPS